MIGIICAEIEEIEAIATYMTNASKNKIYSFKSWNFKNFNWNFKNMVPLECYKTHLKNAQPKLMFRISESQTKSNNFLFT